MAFTEAQKVQLRKYLGRPDTYADQDTSLELAFDAVGGRPATQTEVESILAKLVTVESKLDVSLSTAGMKRAEDIEWYPGGLEWRKKCDEGRRYCARLSVIFNVELAADAFGTAGFRGHSARTGRGGVIPLG